MDSDILSPDFDPLAPPHSVTVTEHREHLAEISNGTYADFLNPETETRTGAGVSTLSPGNLAEALQAGLDKMTDGVTTAVTGSPGLTWSVIPFWVKAAVGGYLLFLILAKK
jgi:hypothetical protein